MEATLLSLAAFCLFGVQADVEVDPNFDLKRFAGKWHVPALASTDPMLQSLKDIITTPAARIVALPNGNLEIETYYLLGEHCEGMKGTYVKTEQPGHFTSSDEKGKKDLRVLASNANFAIVYVQWKMNGMPPSRSLQFYSKDPKGTENLDKFKAYCQKMGLMGELVVPPLSDKCFQQISG
ncbi:prostaglandin-H2 D-isomerase [Pseudonaja textilis]|uniref:prostaglandin-H2 D-isomerase n=1 Tax=Pseudonaja textilis TaxID=8673 RepID=UPI000EA8B6E5|nr:prostaglandin-H2 D-isomerase [Pseudonaja textilis]